MDKTHRSYVSKDYSEFSGPKHYAKLFSVLPKHNSVFNLWGLFIRIGKKLSQGYKQDSFLVIGDYKKIWNRIKIFLFGVPSVLPPLFFQSSVFLDFSHLLRVRGKTRF